MDEQTESRKGGFGKLLWLLAFAAIALLWWHNRQPADATAPAGQEAADRATADYDPDDILVDLKDDATAAQVAALEKLYGIDLQLVSDQSADEQFYRAHIDASRQAQLIAQLKGNSLVEIAEPDAMYSLPPGEAQVVANTDETSDAGYPNDPLYSKQWHMRQIGMPEAWKIADGKGVIVAVLDTGVAYENYNKFKQLPDLEGIEFVKPYNFVSNNVHAGDDHGHGSHVTGTIAQVTNNGIGVAGVARNVRIMPLKVLSAGGSGSLGGIVDAIRYAADNGAKVINMSLGGAFPSEAMKKAVKYAHDKGVTVVCAAGNESRGKVGYPAAYPGAVAISATQQDEAITFYSNYGEAIDIAAPGGNTRDAGGGRGNPDGGVLQNTIGVGDPGKSEYTAYMGTSMAAPHAAGLAALIVAEGVTKPDAVEKVMKETARQPVEQKFDKTKYGAGIIDAPAAIKAARGKSGGNEWELGIGLLFAGAVAASARRKGLGVKLGAGYVGGVVIGACGLFFLPYLSSTLATAPVLSTLSHGLPSWDISLLGPLGHGNAVFFSALIPFGLLAVGYGMPRARAPLAGLAIGVAAHLAVAAAAPMMTLQYVPMVGYATVWLALNALACLGLARLALRK